MGPLQEFIRILVEVQVMDQDLENSYRFCEQYAKKSNFYAGFRLLPAIKHKALSAVYAFLRQCDDISDSEESVEPKKQSLERWKVSFHQAIKDGKFSHPTSPALRETIGKFQIPVDYFDQLITGTEMDLTIHSYETFEDLKKYCYHVASAVGQICIRIFGFDQEQAVAYADDCGVAFQITNILRDIKEDLQRGRIYIPQQDLNSFGYSTEDLQNEIYDARFIRLMQFETERAFQFYERAKPLLKTLRPDSRPAFWAMFQAYRTLLQKIQAQKFQIFGERIHLGSKSKFAIMLKALSKR